MSNADKFGFGSILGRIGGEHSKVLARCGRRMAEQMERAKGLGPWRNQMDKVWTVMLVRQGIIDRSTGAEILGGLLEFETQDPQPSQEGPLGDRIGRDAAGFVNLGRAQIEPLDRLQSRDKTIDLIDLELGMLGTMLDLAAKNTDAVMPGYTHLTQAQTTTFGHYLVSVHDGVRRARNLLEYAYGEVNLDSSGSGALAGTSWPIDRELVANLLGFDGLVENTNDCVGGRDHFITLLTALVQAMTVLSRMAMDLNIWCMEEIGMVSVDPSYCAVSSMMPQKKMYGSEMERVRNDAAKIAGRLAEVIGMQNGEPYGDMRTVNLISIVAMEALLQTECTLGGLTGYLSALQTHKERMVEIARKGFSSATELVNLIIRDKGIPCRHAHHIVGAFVGVAEEAGATAYETTGEMLDEAAKRLGDGPLGLTTEEVREALDPVHFVEVTDSLGGVAPTEVERMIEARREDLAQAEERHADRKNRLAQARAALRDAVSDIVSSE